jgi:hypothetical protein
LSVAVVECDNILALSKNCVDNAFAIARCKTYVYGVDSGKSLRRLIVVLVSFFGQFAPIYVCAD